MVLRVLPQVNPNPRLAARDATDDDCRFLGPRLRQEDVDEVAASAGRGPVEALLVSRSVSDICQTITLSGEPVAMYGRAKHGRIGVPWLLAAPELFSGAAARGFLRAQRGQLERLSSDVDFLTNIVDARNTRHVLWLRRLGFTFFRSVPVGPDSLPFFEFGKLCANPQR